MYPCELVSAPGEDHGDEAVASGPAGSRFEQRAQADMIGHIATTSRTCRRRRITYNPNMLYTHWSLFELTDDGEELTQQAA
jgi:hypothetical protein